MGTPLRHLLISSPKLISPRSTNTTKNYLNVKRKSVPRQLFVSDTKAFSGSAIKSSIQIKIHECEESTSRTSLFVDTPRKQEIFSNGLISTNNLLLLGQGAFGTVVKGRHKGRDVAVKVIKTSPKMNEYNSLQLSHKNLVNILDINKGGTHTIIIMEYLENAINLQSLIDNDGEVINVTEVAKDLCDGLLYCHTKGVLHLDVKPNNIIVLNGICKICDFGNSCSIDDFDGYVHQGTPRYTAPELFSGAMPTEKCDIYSLGITCWQLRHRKLPYADIGNSQILIYKVVKFDLRPVDEQSVDDWYAKLYKSCWHRDPKQRSDLQQIRDGLEVQEWSGV